MKSGEPYCPERGDFIWMNFHPQAGREQDGWRPALVLSPSRYNELSRLCIACPVTTQDKFNRFQVMIPEGLAVSGWVISDQVQSISWFERGSQFKDRCPGDVLADVVAKMRVLLPL